MGKILTVGEIMMRLQPLGYKRLMQADTLEVVFGGGEANVAVSLAQFGEDAVYFTKLPKNALADKCVNQLRGFGVDTTRIIRGGDRMGIYFCEKGCSQRGSNVIYDRANSAIAQMNADEVDVDLDMNDVRVDMTRSSGCGGQGVNTTDSAVRLTHIPTGLVVYSQTERSQIKNKEKAIKILQARLAELKIREAEEKAGAERRNKIGTGDRSEKIRTYNYPQNRVTDHRIGFTLNTLDRVMAGDIDKVIDALITEDQARKLKGEEALD